MNTIQTEDKTHWLAHSKLSCTAAAAALAFSAFQGFAQQVPSQPVKNIVLVHGAFADGSSWTKLIPLLEAKGLHVTAEQNALSALPDEREGARGALSKTEGPVLSVRR